MAKKSSAMKSTISVDINNLKENLIKSSNCKVVLVLDQLIKKEIANCARQLQIECEELQIWVDSYIQAPQRSLLHLLRTAYKYCLDPLQEQILLTQYDQAWQVTISVDGWLKLIHQHTSFAGITFNESPEGDGILPHWMECTIYRHDRVIPTTIREYLSEVKQEGELWNKMPRRMLRHRVLSQCARVAIGITLPAELKESCFAAKNSSLEEVQKPGPIAISGIDQLRIKLSESIESSKGMT